MRPEESFYFWVGKCIKRWASIEQTLFEICHLTLDARRRLSAVVFFRTPNIEAKISLVSDLLEARLFPQGKKSGEHDPQELKDWNALERRLRALLPLRNFVAHNPAKIRSKKSVAGQKPVYDPEQVIVQHGDDEDRRPSSIKRVTTDDMEKHFALVTSLVNDLGKLKDALQVRLE